MANERQTDFILRAQVDQALQPLAQVTQRVKDLIAVLNQQREAAKTGDTSLGEYAKALRDVEKASGDLLKQRAALDNFATRGQRVDTQQSIVTQRQQARDTFAGSLPAPDARTDKETAALAKLDKALASSQSRLETVTIAYTRAAEQLQRLGVITEEMATREQRLAALNPAHDMISDYVLLATEALRAGQAQNDTLLVTLRAAGVARQVAAQRERDTARFLADQEKERQAIIDAAEAIRAKGRASQGSVDNAAARAARQADIEAAFAEADAEAALARERAKFSADFIAQQEREAKAVLDAAEAIRAKGRAAQEAVERGTARNQRQADIEAAFAEADAAAAADKALAASIKALQAEQAQALQGAMRLWEAEEAGARKAREAAEAFRATVEKAVGQARAGRADAAASADALGRPVALPAPTLAARVKEALAPPPGPGTGGGDLAGLQSEIARISGVLTAGVSDLKVYNQELKNLDTVSREAVRQSQIVDSFLKQQKAARDAALAVHAAVVELARLEEVAKTATTPDQISEVTSGIAAQRRKLGSTDEGTGLFGTARAAQEALAREEASLNAIGVTAARVGEAFNTLTNIAVQTSAARRGATLLEKTAIDGEADAILRRAAALSTAPTTAGPSARSAVAAVAGPGRGVGEIADTAAETERLDKTITTAKLTAQSYNRVMEEVFAVQRQIASDAGLIDQFTAQSAAVARSTAAFAAAEAELKRLNAEYHAGTVDIAELRRAEATLTGAANDLQRQATGQAQIDAQLKARRIDTANLTAETDKLVASSQRLAAAQTRANESSGKVLGLSSYQLQNLSFQVNDVITQLSLGQGVLRTFESQAGQIFQIFETSITAMQRMVLYGLPAAAVIATIGLALSRLKDTIDTQREFSRLLAANADGVAYQAKQLTAAARSIEAFGVSFDDAKTAVKTFMHDGLSVDSMMQFAKTAHLIADTTGGTFVDALKSVSVIAHGSYEDIAKLNEEFNFLHANELAAIKDAFDAGNAETGRSIAINAATTAFQKGRDQGIDPFREGIRNLTTAWKEFLDAIGSTRILTNVVNNLAGIARLAADTATALRLVFKPTQEEAANRVSGLQTALKATQDQIEKISKTGVPEDEPLSILKGRARDLTRQIEEAIQARDRLASGGVPGGPNTPGAASASDLGARSPSAVALTHLGENASQVAPFLTGQNINPIVTAWCAAFANAALQAAGLPGSGSNVATSFEKWGNAVAKGAIQAGDVLVQARGHDAGEPGGHVGIATGNFKTGPDGAVLVEMVSGNHGGRVERSFERESELDARRAPGTGSNFPGFQRNPSATNADAARQQAVVDDLEKKANGTVDELLRGNARVLSDQQRLFQYWKDLNNEVDAKLQGAPRSPDVQKAFNKAIDDFAKKLDDSRIRQEEAANNATLQLVRSAQEQVDKVNKTDPAAQRRVVDAQFEKQLSALNEQLAHGATEIAGQSISGARDALLKVRDQAREQATVASDRAIVDDTVKARDEKISGVEADLKSGAITLQQAFDRIALIVKSFRPAIEAAVGKSNADLSRQPQTAAIQEQLAKNTRIDAKGTKAAEQADLAGEAKINELLSARSNLVKELDDQVANGTKSRRAADLETLAIYAKFKPQITELTEALQAQIDVQRENGLISEEVYAKISAAIQKAKASSDNLTATQRKMAQEIDNSIVNHALQGIETVATAIGAAIAGTGKWSDVLRSVGIAFANFAAGVLKDIAAMIIKQTILNALQEAGVGAKGAGLFGTGAAASSGSTASAVELEASDTFATLAHEGGIAGSLNMGRRVNAAMFTGAPRMHSGGMVGLAGNEVATVLKKGEEVLTANDPRHRNNMKSGGGQGAAGSIRNILVLDEKDLAGAMAGAHGENVVINHIKRNGAAIRQLIGAK